MSVRLENQPKVRVGIMSASEINFTLLDTYRVNGEDVTGDQKVVMDGDKILWNGKAYDTLTFEAGSEDSSFELKQVTIGVNFHWQRNEDQRFAGDLSFLFEKGLMTAVNSVSVEKYLESVISSEMSANASLEFLKAHAVISRSWLLAQMAKRDSLSTSGTEYNSRTVTETEITAWTDREAHHNFTVCADDHCQRYQGMSRQTTPRVAQAVAETRGEVLTYDDEICDARFSKCCGGVLEQFEFCWEPRHFDYLEARRDAANEYRFPDLRTESKAVEWIERRPEAFCDTTDTDILSQVFNAYDRETTDFYRWSVEYDNERLSQLICEKSGIDFGSIIDLKPLSRGTSGRLYRLLIVGTKRSMIVGKELEIRRWLSPSHLYSSAFTVERQDIDSDTGVPQRIILRGAGWGHGVGLCQIGAAVMSTKGYDYQRILSHYFSGAEITTCY